MLGTRPGQPQAAGRSCRIRSLRDGADHRPTGTAREAVVDPRIGDLGPACWR